MSHSVVIVAYLALFAAVGFAFVLVNLLIGRFLRPANPHPEKQEIYECGEPTIGTSFVQFDLRFYVVALVFIVFDVEVAFMFPWATVYGKATHLMRVGDQPHQMPAIVATPDGEVAWAAETKALYHELGVSQPKLPAGDALTATRAVQEGAKQLALLSACAMAAFFFVLLLGFAYEWKTGSMDWVHATTRSQAQSLSRAPPNTTSPQESVLSA